MPKTLIVIAVDSEASVPDASRARNAADAVPAAASAREASTPVNASAAASVASAAAESVATPMSYVPPSPAQQTTGWSSPLSRAIVAKPVATAGALANVVAATGAPYALVGKAPAVEHIAASQISVEDGSATIAHSNVRYLSGSHATATLESSDLAYVSGVHSDFEIHQSTVGGALLSYSRASVTDCRFTGERSSIVFHGASGGTFEGNSFLASATEVEVRHTSNPTFRHNNFLSPSTRVVCGTYQLPTCVGMEENWWGTTEESLIATRFAAGCPVCYTPWLTAPWGGTFALACANPPTHAPRAWEP